jgi:hypothetical protein
LTSTSSLNIVTHTPHPLNLPRLHRRNARTKPTTAPPSPHQSHTQLSLHTQRPLFLFQHQHPTQHTTHPWTATATNAAMASSSPASPLPFPHPRTDPTSSLTAIVQYPEQQYTLGLALTGSQAPGASPHARNTYIAATASSTPMI